MANEKTSKYAFSLSAALYPQLPVDPHMYAQHLRNDQYLVKTYEPMTSQRVSLGELFQERYRLFNDEAYGLTKIYEPNGTPVSRILVAPGAKPFRRRVRAVRIRSGGGRRARYRIGPFSGEYVSVCAGENAGDIGPLEEVISPSVGNGVLVFRDCYVPLLNPEATIRFMARGPDAPHPSAPVGEDGERPVEAFFMTKSSDPAMDSPRWFSGAFYPPSASSAARFAVNVHGRWITTATFNPRSKDVIVHLVSADSLLQFEALNRQVRTLRNSLDHAEDEATRQKMAIAIQSLSETAEGYLTPHTKRFSLSRWPKTLRFSPDSQITPGTIAAGRTGLSGDDASP